VTVTIPVPEVNALELSATGKAHLAFMVKVMAWKKKNVITPKKIFIFIRSRDNIRKTLKYRNINFILVLIKIN
jgi:hypothetical protein